MTTDDMDTPPYGTTPIDVPYVGTHRHDPDRPIVLASVIRQSHRYSIWVRRQQGDPPCQFVAQNGQRAWLFSHASHRASVLRTKCGYYVVEVRLATQSDLAPFQRSQIDGRARDGLSAQSAPGGAPPPLPHQTP
jgi:hypothetical protein